MDQKNNHNKDPLYTRRGFLAGVARHAIGSLALIVSGTLIVDSLGRGSNSPDRGENTRELSTAEKIEDLVDQWVDGVANSSRAMPDQLTARRSISGQGIELFEMGAVRFQMNAKAGEPGADKPLDQYQLSSSLVDDQITSSLRALEGKTGSIDVDSPKARLVALMTLMMINQDILVDDGKELQRLLTRLGSLDHRDSVKVEELLNESITYLSQSYVDPRFMDQTVFAPRAADR